MLKYCLFPFLLSASLAWGEPTVRLTTHDLPPYGSYRGADHRFGGIAVDVVDCVMRKLDRAYRLQVVPWARAQKLVPRGEADGFLAASRNAERDRYATSSVLIAEQEWRWYLMASNPADPRSESFRRTATVGSFIGANMLDWLRENGYRVEAKPGTTEQLLVMLTKGRVDAILANHLVMAELAKKHSLESQLRSVLQENRPLGVYFSKVFLEKNPGFLARFDQQVPRCRGTVVTPH